MKLPWKSDIYEYLGFWAWFKDQIPYGLKHFYWQKIRPIFAPQHQELRKAIPRTWSDLDYCMEEFLWACVISYVEKEMGLEHWEYQDENHPAKQEAKMLREVYEYAKTGRFELQKQLENAYPPLLPEIGVVEYLEKTNSYDYSEVFRLEKLIEEKEDKYLGWIVKNRKLFWT